MKISVHLVLLGGDNVGKSCFLHRIMEDQYDSTILSTVGVTHHQKQCIIKGESIKIDIFDTPGVKSLRLTIYPYLHYGHGFLVFYDITDESSLEQASFWINEIRDYCREKDIMLIGTKCDLESERKISQFEINQFATKMRIFR